MSPNANTITDDPRYEDVFTGIGNGNHSQNSRIVANVIAALAECWAEDEPADLETRQDDLNEVISALKSFGVDDDLVRNPIAKRWQITYACNTPVQGPYYSRAEAVTAAYDHVSASTPGPDGFPISFKVELIP